MARVRRKEGENLSAENIERVIEALNRDNPITKKSACEMLNISYNTTRLNKIISEYNERKEYVKARKKQMRTQPLSIADKREIVQSYLSGVALNDIADSTFRSVGVVKRVLKSYNVPFRSGDISYHNPVFLDDDALTEDYEKGDLVFSARYNCPAYITKRYKHKEGAAYQMWLVSANEQYVTQPYYELANLTKLQSELGIELSCTDQETINYEIIQARIKSRKRDKK